MNVCAKSKTFLMFVCVCVYEVSDIFRENGKTFNNYSRHVGSFR